MHTVDFHIHDGILHLVDDVLCSAGAAVLVNLDIQGVTGIDIQFIAEHVGFFVIQGGVVFDGVYKLLVSRIDCGGAQGHCGHHNHQQRTENGDRFFHAKNLAFVIWSINGYLSIMTLDILYSQILGLYRDIICQFVVRILVLFVGIH